MIQVSFKIYKKEKKKEKKTLKEITLNMLLDPER